MAVNQTKKRPGVVMEAITVALNHRSSGEATDQYLLEKGLFLNLVNLGSKPVIVNS